MPYITGARLKAERAGKHLEELEREIASFFDENPYRFFRDSNPQNLDYYTYKFPPQPAPPPALSVILGDIVHNLRSALDHVAWQLALRTTDDPYKRTAFPIFVDTSLASVKQFNRLVKDVFPDAIPIIEALQPYHSGEGLAEFDLLWVLHCLWNADKHRLLTTIPHRISSPIFEGPGGSTRTLDDGTILMDIPKSAEPEKNLEPHIKRQVLFQIPGSRRVAIERISLMYYYVAHEIIPMFSRYLPESTGLVEREFRVQPRP